MNFQCIHFIAELPTFTLAPAISVCILVPGILAALVLAGFLYREQRRMASAGMVLVLTMLRGLLILLLAVLFLQPALRWSHTTISSGTLWILTDQSPSMQSPDPQASEAERLRWAEGLGMVARTAHHGEWAARAHVLNDELDALVPPVGTGMGGDAERKQIQAFSEATISWAADVEGLADDLVGGKPANKTALNHAAEMARQDAREIARGGSLKAAREALKLFPIHQGLEAVEKDLRELAASDEADFLKKGTSQSDWLTARSRMADYTRGDFAQGTLAGSDSKGAKALASLADKYHIRIASFSDKVQAAGLVDKHSLAEAVKSSLAPGGQSTNMAGTLQFIAEQVSPGEAASVVLVTDGRSNTGSDPTGAARNLAARGVRIFGLLAGSREMSPDAAVEPVDFPDWIYAGDSIKPRSLVRLDGLQGKTAELELRRDGELLERRSMRAAGMHEMIPFDFTDMPTTTDKVLQYEIRIAPLPGEVNTQNNVATFRVAVKKEKLAALIVEDRPRWEYRYLAGYLSQRQGFKLQTVLREPAQVTGVAAAGLEMASPENPRTEAQRLPETLEGWEKFDLIVLGDVGPDFVTPQMQQYIAAAVRDKGSTLICIAGMRSMPGKFANSPLAELLPVTLTSQWSSEEIARHLKLGFRPESAPTAGMSTLAQLGADVTGNVRAWQSMPPWYWHSGWTEAKPAASVIWMIPSTVAGGGAGPAAWNIADANRHALLSTMPIGLGHSLYLASDQTWRLRQIGGANLHNRFWGQVLNWAVGSDLPAGGKFVRFGVNQPTYEQTQPVVVTARILKDDLTPYTGLSFTASARGMRSGNTGTAEAAGGAVEARFSPMESPGYYQATLTGLPVGDVEISLRGGEVERLLNNDPTVTVRTLLIKVFPVMNAERQNMNTDAAMLEAVSRAGAGFSLDLPYADLLFSRMPKIEHEETSVYQLGFFTDPAAQGTKVAHWGFLGLFLTLITVEWALRKRAGLV